ncbi:MAG: hypothetical protein ACU85V_04535 [Gammaproteobacteria bacterium]
MAFDQQDPTWENGVKTLFTDADRRVLEAQGCDCKLDDYHSVLRHAHEIREILSSGPDKWPPRKLHRFSLWIWTGMPQGAPGLVSMVPASPSSGSDDPVGAEPPATSAPPLLAPLPDPPAIDMRHPVPGGGYSAVAPLPHLDVMAILGERGELSRQSAAAMSTWVAMTKQLGKIIEDNFTIQRRAHQTRNGNACVADYVRFAIDLYADSLQAIGGLPVKGALWFYAETARQRRGNTPTL